MLPFFEFVAWVHHPRNVIPALAYEESSYPRYNPHEHDCGEGHGPCPECTNAKQLLTPPVMSLSSPVVTQTAPYTVQFPRPHRRLHYPSHSTTSVPGYRNYLNKRAKQEIANGEGSDEGNEVEIRSEPLHSQPYYTTEEGLIKYPPHLASPFTAPSERRRKRRDSYLKRVDPMITAHDKKNKFGFYTYFFIASVMLLLCLIPF